MTREQAILQIEYRKDFATPDQIQAIDMAINALKYDDTKYHEEHGEVIVSKDVWEDAKKALKQMDALEKIRTEIEQNAYPIVHGVNNHEKGMTLYGILQIIDKYKTESEETE